MKTPKAFWIGLLCAVGGCTQILELDNEYRPGQSSSSSGEAGSGLAGGSGGMAGNGSGGIAGMAGAGGMGGSGGAVQCVIDMDCPPPVNNCTAAACVSNMCVTNNLPNTATCTPDGLTFCDGNGICGECNQPSDCTALPPDDECQTRTCDNHICSQMFAPTGTALMNQTVGDCLDAFCDGTGKTITMANNADIPEDNNPCTKNTCVNGAPMYPNEPINTSCGGTLKCNGMGQCVGCILATDCSGVDDFCKMRACNGGMCQPIFTTAGTDLPTGQITGDCKVVECDGNGNIVNTPSNADVPVDANQCTKDVCTAGVPSNPVEPSNTPCGTGGLCNATGVCKNPNGTSCMTGVECSSGNCIEGRCCDTTCTQECKACNVAGSVGICTIVPAGYADDTCPSPKSCDGTMGGNSCTAKFPMGYPCTSNTQCGSGICADGVCCSSSCTAACKSCNVAGAAGTCTNVPLGQPDGACSGTRSCDGTGTCKNGIGASCTLNSECLNGICVDGVCCNSNCGGLCQACTAALKGTGADGTCGPVAAGSDPQNECTDNGAATCKQNGSCSGSGTCQQYASGTTCVPQSCTGSTQFNTDSCNGTGTCVDGGSLSCSPYVCGTIACKTTCASDSDCVSTHYCSGTACVLKLINGQSCAGTNQCSSGICIDNVCCNAGCLGTCQACNMIGSMGSCVNVPIFQEDPVATTPCNGLNSCNGMGACLLDNGQTCTTNAECASNNCAGTPPTCQ